MINNRRNLIFILTAILLLTSCHYKSHNMVYDGLDDFGYQYSLIDYCKEDYVSGEVHFDCPSGKIRIQFVPVPEGITPEDPIMSYRTYFLNLLSHEELNCGYIGKSDRMKVENEAGEKLPIIFMIRGGEIDAMDVDAGLNLYVFTYSFFDKDTFFFARGYLTTPGNEKEFMDQFKTITKTFEPYTPPTPYSPVPDK